jgi:hypothetical protein
VLRTAALGALMLLNAAHVGSPDAWYDGPAGPFHVLVHIEAPGVIPGIAVVNVKVTGGSVERVTAVGNTFNAPGGAPPPEIAKPVDGAPGWYRTTLWIMTSGSHSITVGVIGAAGEGTAVVPLVAVPIRRLGFDPRLAWGLGALGAILAVGLLTLVGAAVREGVLPPGVEPDARRRRLGWIARAGVTVVVTVLLLGGWRWWNIEDRAFVASMYRPMASVARIDDGPDGRLLTLAIRDSAWIMRNELRRRGRALIQRTALIADHGKLMHMFVVGERGSSFAHLHPATADSVAFATPLPPLPPGRYHVFGDIVHESGLAETLVSTMNIPAAATQRAPLLNPDDAWVTHDADQSAQTVSLADGIRMTWLRGDSVSAVGLDASLRFAIATTDGAPLALEPYMGMTAHAVVMRDDGGVFIHLHPQGTISTAAQRSFIVREAGDTIPGRLAARLGADTAMTASSHTQMTSTAPRAAAIDTVSFPYAFPEPGSYHIWVQVKRSGRVQTGVFAATVGERR